MLNNSSQTISVHSYQRLSKGQQAELDSFLSGLIRGYLLHKQSFTAGDLVGNAFGNWDNTPLYPIYEYHYNRQNQGIIISAEAESGKDVGRLIKNALAKEKGLSFIISGTLQRKWALNIYSLVTEDIEDDFLKIEEEVLSSIK